MLIEPAYKVGDVVTIKPTSGEELVGKFEADDDKSIKVNKPLTLVASEKGIGYNSFCLLLIWVNHIQLSIKQLL